MEGQCITVDILCWRVAPNSWPFVELKGKRGNESLLTTIEHWIRWKSGWNLEWGDITEQKRMKQQIRINNSITTYASQKRNTDLGWCG